MWEWFKKIFIGEFNKIEEKVNDQITDSVTQVKEQLDKSIDKFIDNIKSDDVKPKKKPKIFESPDGGKTIYSRDIGGTEKTLVKKPKKNGKK